MSNVDTSDVDALFLLICAVLSLFTQAGFAMRELGSVQSKNSENILIKNLLNLCVVVFWWWMFGYTMAAGPDDASNFMGTGSYVAMSGLPDGLYMIHWLFRLTFAANAVTIVAGALAERTQLQAYPIVATVMMVWIYPIVAYWVWGAEGWLKQAGSDSYNDGLLDFAGSGVVHVVGGACALVGAWFVGPRLHMDSGKHKVEQRGSKKVNTSICKPRFLDGAVTKPKVSRQNASFTVLGTLLLWFGWFGLNAGSQMAITGENLQVVSSIAVNTVLAPAGALLAIFLICWDEYNVQHTANAVLGALVSISACCNSVQPWAAVLIGMISAPIYKFSSDLLIKLQIDDVLNAGPVHFCCGLWGLFATGIFVNTDLANMNEHNSGIFYSKSTGGGVLLGWQICGMLVITLWTVLWSGLLFFGLSKANLLRISESEEKAGLDGAHISKFVAKQGKKIIIQSPLAKLAPKDRVARYVKMSKAQREDLEETLSPNDRAAMIAEMSDAEREKHDMFVFVVGCKTNLGIVKSEPVHTRYDDETETLEHGLFVDVYDEKKMRTRECRVEDLVLANRPAKAAEEEPMSPLAKDLDAEVHTPTSDAAAANAIAGLQSHQM